MPDSKSTWDLVAPTLPAAATLVVAIISATAFERRERLETEREARDRDRANKVNASLAEWWSESLWVARQFVEMGLNRLHHTHVHSISVEVAQKRRPPEESHALAEESKRLSDVFSAMKRDFEESSKALRIAQAKLILLDHSESRRRRVQELSAQLLAPWKSDVGLGNAMIERGREVGNLITAYGQDGFGVQADNTNQD